jgi:hypothetical protein
MQRIIILYKLVTKQEDNTLICDDIERLLVLVATLIASVVEPHHFYAAPAPTLLFTEPNFKNNNTQH